jgi:hypothetical protein
MQMQTKGIIALGQFPVTGLYNMNQSWNTSHFRQKLINQKSSITSRGLDRTFNRDQTIYGQKGLIQVPWGCGDSVDVLSSVPTSSTNGQIITKDGKTSSSIQKFSVHRMADRCKVMCPVCGKILSKGNLPDAEGIFTDGICYYETDKIISSSLFIEHEFSHFYNEEDDCAMENPHELKALIQAAFDAEGECTGFQLVKVWAAPE